MHQYNVFSFRSVLFALFCRPVYMPRMGGPLHMHGIFEKLQLDAGFIYVHTHLISNR